MAVTTEKSATLTRFDDESPQDLVSPRDWLGRVRYIKVDFTQGGAAGDANSTADLARLPQGKCSVVGGLTTLYYDAFGTGRTLDIGHTGYTTRDGTVKAAVADFFVDGEDVAAAGSTEFDNVDHQSDNGLDADHVKEFDARDRVTIQAIVLGGTIPAGTKIWGHIAVVVD